MTVALPSRGAPSGRVLIETMDFEVTRPGEPFVVVATCAFGAASDELYVWLKVRGERE